MLEYPDPAARQVELQKLIGVEDRVYVRVEGFDPVFPVADEDLERETETKTSSVHFMRFELSPDMVRALKSGASVAVGIDHPAYSHAVPVLPAAIRDSLVADLDCSGGGRGVPSGRRPAHCPPPAPATRRSP
jgi:hypothetical protein